VTDRVERNLTKYEVFRVDDEGRWVSLAHVETSAGTYACQMVAQGEQVEGEYRAVPVRNITEVKMGYEAPAPPKLVPLFEDEAPQSVAVPPAQAPEEEQAQTLAAEVLDEPPTLVARIREQTP
jgi:hypothetical protein